jgi:hypothetical protein
MAARKKASASTAVIETPAAPAPTPGSKVDYDAAKHIIINSKVYDRETFTPEQVQQISAVNYADQHIASAEQDLKIYKYGRDNMVKQLLEDITAVEPIGTVDPPEEGE